MHKARLPRQTGLDEAFQELAPSSCGMNENDPACFGYWSRDEVLRFLVDLLEAERLGFSAFSAVGRVVYLRVADLAFESELAQGAICVLLKKEIARRGKTRTARQMTAHDATMKKRDLHDTVAFARNNQIRLADMIEEAVLNILDAKLNAKLMYLQLLHRKQVELLETLRPNAPAAS